MAGRTLQSETALINPMPISSVLSGTTTPSKPVQSKLYVFELCKKVKPRGPESSPFTPYKTLSAEQTVYDEIAGRERTLRYLKGIKTIWVDEQIALDLSDQFVNDPTNLWMPEFKEGKLFLRAPQDQLKIDFMLNRDDYEGKKIRINPSVPPAYRWANQETSSNVDWELIELRKKATDLAMNTKYEELVPHASFLGIAFRDMYHQDKTEKAIRTEYYNKADKEPRLFIQTYDSPTMKLKFQIKNALEQGKIDLTHVKGQAHWGNTKAFIKVLDMNKLPVDDLTDYAFTNDGAPFYKEISKSS